jgi:hypothetical protein
MEVTSGEQERGCTVPGVIFLPSIQNYATLSAQIIDITHLICNTQATQKKYLRKK